MNEQKRFETREIDLIDYLKRLLEQWRGLLVFGLLLAILFSGITYLRDYKKYRASVASATAADTKTDFDSTALRNALSYYQLSEQRKAYLSDSILMQVEPSRETVLKLTYYLASDEPGTADINSVGYAVIGGLDNETFFAEMAECLGKKESAPYIHELYNALLNDDKSMTADQTGCVLTIPVILPESSDAEKITGIVTEHLNRICDRIGDAMGAFSLRIISSDCITKSDTSTLQKQAEALSRLETAQNGYTKALSVLNNDEKAFCNALIKSDQVGSWLENGTIDVTEKEKAAQGGSSQSISQVPPAFNMKTALIGFVLGIILYIIIYFLVLLFVPRIRREDEASRMHHIRSYGGIYQYPYQTPLKRFLHSKRIFAWRHKNAGIAADDAKMIAEAVASKASHMDLDAVSVLSLGKENSFVSSILDQQNAVLSEQNLKAERIHAEKGVASIEESAFDRMYPVLIVLLSNITTPRMVSDLLSRLKEYDIPVLGTEFIEG